MSTQTVDVRLVNRGRGVGQLDREVAQRALPWGELCLPVVMGDVLRELFCGALGTEVVGVRDRSVVTVLSSGGNGREQLALAAREPRLAEHDLFVQGNRRAEHRGPEAHRLQDVEDLPGSLDGRVVLFLEEAVGLGLLDQP